jgi:hypothetical protein
MLMLSTILLDVGIYGDLRIHVEPHGTKGCVLYLCLAILGILLSLCHFNLSQSRHVASQWICGLVGIASSSQFLGTIGYRSKLVICRLLCHGRNVGKCRGFAPVLGLCQ